MSPFCLKLLNVVAFGKWTDCVHSRWDMDRETWDQYCIDCMDTPARAAVRREVAECLGLPRRQYFKVSIGTVASIVGHQVESLHLLRRTA